MRQSVLAQAVTTGSSGVGFALRTVEIIEVDADQNICRARDIRTNEGFQLGLNKRGSSTVWPQVGDAWLIDRSMGHWALKSKITDTAPPTITGNTRQMNADVLNLVQTLASMGLVIDDTAAGLAPPSITGSRTQMDAGLQRLIDILAGENLLTDGTTAASALPTISGSRTKMDPALGTLIDILRNRGVLNDSTTASAGLPTLSGSRDFMAGHTGDIIDALATRGVLIDSTTAATLPIATWQTPSLSAPWVNFSDTSYQTPRYRRQPFGEVIVEGVIYTNGTSVSGTTTVFNLPTGFRPPKTLVFAAQASGNVTYQLEVTGGGTVQFRFLPTGAVTWVSIMARFSVV